MLSFVPSQLSDVTLLTRAIPSVTGLAILRPEGACLCGQDVGVYVAPDVGQLERRIDRKERVWCGWEHFLGGPDNECIAHVTPFGQSIIAVADHKDKNTFRTGVHLHSRT